MAVGLVIAMGLFIKFCAVHTPSSNPKAKPARKLTDTLRRRRNPRQGQSQPQQVRYPQVSIQGKNDLELHVDIIASDKVLFLSRKVFIFFFFLHKSICYWYSLEVPHWGTSNEYPQHMFSWRNRKNIIDTTSSAAICSIPFINMITGNFFQRCVVFVNLISTCKHRLIPQDIN